MFTPLLQLQLDIAGQAADQDLPFAQVGEGFSQFLSTLFSAVMVIGVISVLSYFVWGSLDWINSGGEKGKIDSARNKMTGAVTGLFVLACVFAFFMFIQRIFGIEVLRFDAPGPTAPSGSWI